MLGRKPCPSPAAESNSITKARNDETTKSNQGCLFPRPAMLRDRSLGSANATPLRLGYLFSGFRRFVVSCPVFRVRGYYQSRPRCRPTFSEAERTRLNKKGQQKLNRRSRRSRRGGIARAQAAAHFSRVRAITTGTAHSVWAQRSQRSAFAWSEPSFAAKLRVLCELLFNDPGQSHVAGGVWHAMICKLQQILANNLRAGSVGVTTCCQSAMNCGVVLSLCRRQSAVRSPWENCVQLHAQSEMKHSALASVQARRARGVVLGTVARERAHVIGRAVARRVGVAGATVSVSDRSGALPVIVSPPIDSYVTVLAAEMNTRCVPVPMPVSEGHSAMVRASGRYRDCMAGTLIRANAR